MLMLFKEQFPFFLMKASFLGRVSESGLILSMKRASLPNADTLESTWTFSQRLGLFVYI